MRVIHLTCPTLIFWKVSQVECYMNRLRQPQPLITLDDDWGLLEPNDVP